MPSTTRSLLSLKRRFCSGVKAKRSQCTDEVLPSAVGCRVPNGMGSIVLVELVLPVVRQLAENPDVRVVAHDRAPPGSGTGSATATASGNG